MVVRGSYLFSGFGSEGLGLMELTTEGSLSLPEALRSSLLPVSPAMMSSCSACPHYRL